MAEGCQAVKDGRRRGGFGDSIQDAFALKKAEARSKNLCGNSFQVGLQFGKATLSGTQEPDEICGPSASDQAHATLQRTFRRGMSDEALASFHHMLTYRMATRF